MQITEQLIAGITAEDAGPTLYELVRGCWALLILIASLEGARSVVALAEFMRGTRQRVRERRRNPM